MHKSVNNTAKTESTFDYVAVDIGKSELHIKGEARRKKIDNTISGWNLLLKYLKTLPSPLVVLEASGGYERGLIEFLQQSNIPYCLVNPARIRAFAGSEGIKAKSDPIDTNVILKFAKEKSLQPSIPKSSAEMDLAAFMDRRSHLSDQITMEKNRIQNSPSVIHASIQHMIDVLEEELQSIEAKIKDLVRSNAQFKKDFDIMTSVCGIGPTTAWTILAYLGEITKLNRNSLAAMVGVAPYNNDSSTLKGKRSISGGRAKIRKCLFMAARTAVVHNDVLRPYYEGLMARGKEYKCAIVAAMRKLLIHVQSLLKKARVAQAAA